jgi:predicted nucleic acid-binding Zn ribbon protein
MRLLQSGVFVDELWLKPLIVRHPALPTFSRRASSACVSCCRENTVVHIHDLFPETVPRPTSADLRRQLDGLGLCLERIFHLRTEWWWYEEISPAT